MNKCTKCGDEFPNWLTIGEKKRNLSSRKHCLKCVPFNSIQKPMAEEFRARKRTNTKKWYWAQKELLGRDPITEIRERHRLLILGLVETKCQVCGYDRYHGNLVFHHMLDKKHELSNRTFRWSFKRMLPEIKKCIIICHNCHGEVHKGIIDDTNFYHTKFLNKLKSIEKCQDWKEVKNALVA